MNSSHNFLSSMDRLSASLSTPLGSRTAMERDFDRKFMAGINLKKQPESTFSSAGSSLAPLSTGFSATSSRYSAGIFRTSDYSQSRRALPQDSTSSPTGSSPTYNLGHTSPACGKSYRTYNSISRIWLDHRHGACIICPLEIVSFSCFCSLKKLMINTELHYTSF